MSDLTIEQAVEILNREKWRGRDDWFINGTFATYPLGRTDPPHVQYLESLPDESAIAIAKSIELELKLSVLEPDCEQLSADNNAQAIRISELEHALAAVTEEWDALQVELKTVNSDWQSKHEDDMKGMREELHDQTAIARTLRTQLADLKRVVEPFRTSTWWGKLKAWIVHGPPDREQGLDAAARLTKHQVELERALATLETGK